MSTVCNGGALDKLFQPVSAGDFVVFTNNIYEVLGVNPSRRTDDHGALKLILVDRSRTTRPVFKHSSDVVVVPKEAVMAWLLHKSK